MISPNTEDKRIAIAVITGVIALIKALSSLYQVDRKAAVNEQIAMKIRKLILTLQQADPIKIKTEMVSMYQQFQDLDVSLFSEDYLGPTQNLASGNSLQEV
jgi:hypothetical protein